MSMILEYDASPNATVDEKVQTLKESVQRALETIDESVENIPMIKGIGIDFMREQWYLSDSNTELIGGQWLYEQGEWTTGKWLWTRNEIIYSDSSIKHTSPALADSVNSAYQAAYDASQATDNMKNEISSLLRIESSRGTVFKNDRVSTVLSVVIYHGSKRITDLAGLRETFGPKAYLQWKWQRLDENSFGIISRTDERFREYGFLFVLSPDDVDTKITFMCELIV